MILTPMWHSIFHTVWLGRDEWYVVLFFSLPVVILDEILKFWGRCQTAAELKARTGSN